MGDGTDPYQGSSVGCKASACQRASCASAQAASAGVLPLLHALRWQLVQERLAALDDYCWGKLASELKAQAPKTA